MKETIAENPENFPYGLSKAILHKLTELNAKEHPNLTINVVSPGYVKTDMTGNKGGISPEQGA